MDTAVGIRNGDLVTLIIYFTITVAIGIWCSMRLKSTEGYFVGGRSIPGWAVGISMLGTAISSVSFLAYPGNAFKSDWQMLVPGLTIPFATLLAAAVFIPFYRKVKLVSVFEYLEMRFSVWARVYGCIMWSIYSFFRMGVVLLLLSLPIQAMTGYDLAPIIIFMGILVTLYTVVGGLEAVIWTDVMQTIVLFFGGFICVIVAMFGVPEGFSGLLSEGWAGEKFVMIGDTDWSLFSKTLWVILLFGFFQNFQEFACDQTKVQRYCAAASDKEAKWAVWIGGTGCIPIWIMFMFLGTCLWVFYNHNPDPKIASLVGGGMFDSVFPHFILTQLPVGISGFVIAAVIAAAMSSIDSSMNGTATVLTTDIYRRFFAKDKDDRHYLMMARFLTGFAGVFMIIWALALSQNKDAILEIAFAIYAVLAAGVGGIYFLGFFTKRANSQGVLFGIVAAVIVTTWMCMSAVDPEYFSNPQIRAIYENYISKPYSSPFHRLLINVFNNLAAFFVGYGVSYLFSAPPSNKVDGLTWWTRDREISSDDN